MNRTNSRTKRGDPIESGGTPPHSKTLSRWPQSLDLPPGFGVRRPGGAFDFSDRFMVSTHVKILEVFPLSMNLVAAAVKRRQMLITLNQSPRHCGSYLHFSAPMSRGHIYGHIHLRNQTGQEIELPFLEIDEELWDPTMTRLVIDRAWKDGSGKPLKETFQKTFKVGPPDRDPPDPTQWLPLEPSVVARLDFSGGVYLDVWRNGSGGGTGGRCPPGPLGFIAFMLLQQKVAPGDPGGHPAFCCLQPPDGARVASPQSPILRWRKGGPLHDGGEGPFPFPLPWRSIGRASWERGWAGGPSPELSGARLELLRL